MKNLKQLAIALGSMAITSTALAIPTLVISDGTTTTSLTSASGIVNYSNTSLDGFWSVVISTGETKPALGTATAPVFDLNVQATSLAGSTGHNLVVTFSDNNFGPLSGTELAQISGHLVSGTAGAVTYKTFSDAGNTTGATTTQLTTSGSLSGPTYNNTASGPISGTLFSITQQVTVSGGAAGGSYSLDASLSTVPDGGATIALLGGALSSLAYFRRKLA